MQKKIDVNGLVESLTQDIEMERNELHCKEIPNMPAKTFVAVKKRGHNY